MVFYLKFGERWWYRHVCAVGGVFNILLMMGGNLIGFVLGMDGAQYFAHELVSSWAGKEVSLSQTPTRTSLIDIQNPKPPGIRFLFVACACLFVGVQLMFEYRYVRFVSFMNYGRTLIDFWGD
jgi:hypothetical protein